MLALFLVVWLIIWLTDCLIKELYISKCVEKIAHSCGSRNGLQVFLQDNGTYDGFCFACGKHEPNPYKDRPEGYKPQIVFKSPEDVQEELREIGTYQTVDLPERKLKKYALEYFGVRIGIRVVMRNRCYTIFL